MKKNETSNSIIPLSTIKDIASHVIINEHTLVVFDIDHTLLRPKSFFGTHLWVDLIFKALQKKHHYSFKQVNEMVNYALTHLNIDVEAVEEEMTIFVKNLHQQNIPAFALTGRPFSTHQRTLRELGIIGLDFTRTSPAHSATSATTLNSIPYHKGVLFSRSSVTESKGKILLHFLRTIDYQPEKIVFIDDYDVYVNSVHTETKAQKIPSFAFHYTYGNPHTPTAEQTEEHALELFYAAFPQFKPHAAAIESTNAKASST